jgi:hypothetical protein
VAVDPNTQIGPDGRRYEIGSVPSTPTAADRVRRILVVAGTPGEGDVVWQDPDTDTAKWATFDEVATFVPSSS